MLYISRVNQNAKYIVVDTDDNTETACSWNDLCAAVLTHNLDIKGVKVDDIGGIRSILRVTPYQPPNSFSPAQVKAKVLMGVEFTISNGLITMVTVDARVSKGDPKVRLSDYASKVSANLRVKWTNNADNKTLILILDDKMEVVDGAPSCILYGIKWDITDYHNAPIVSHLYRELLQSAGMGHQYWSMYLIDSPLRDQFWHCVSIVESNSENYDTFRLEIAHMPDSAKVQKMIVNTYKAEWAKFVKSGIDLEQFTGSQKQDAIHMVYKYLERGDDVDYGRMRLAFLNMLKLLRLAHVSYYTAISTLNNYMWCFDVDDEIKKLYTQLCNNLIREVKAYCQKHPENKPDYRWF